MQENKNPDKFSSEDLHETKPESAGEIVNEYVVEEKDTLPDIARRYGISIDQIREANKDQFQNLSDMIQPGTRLLIPGRSHK